MRKPVTFRPTEEDDEALDAVAADFPAIAGSMTKLIRKALEEYKRRGSTELRLQKIEQDIKEIKSTVSFQRTVQYGSLDKRVKAIEDLISGGSEQ